MKKNLFFVAATLAAMFGTTSCVNEVDMFKTAGTGKINLSITNDDAIETRAVKTVTDNDSWIIKVGSDSYTLSGLATKAFASGEYAITAASHADEASASATSDNARGAAYYSGSTTATVTAGNTTNTTISCGQAQNGRVEVEFSQDFKTAFPKYNLAVTGGTAIVNFDADKTDPAYFAHETSVSYVLSYGKAATTEHSYESATSFKINAHTAHKLSFKTNGEGQISLTIEYNDEFGSSTVEDVTFDAMNGTKK